MSKGIRIFKVYNIWFYWSKKFIKWKFVRHSKTCWTFKIGWFSVGNNLDEFFEILNNNH